MTDDIVAYKINLVKCYSIHRYKDLEHFQSRLIHSYGYDNRIACLKYNLIIIITSTSHICPQQSLINP